MQKWLTAAALVPLVLLSSACQDDPVNPSPARKRVVAAAGTGPVLEHRALSAFDVELSASGSMQPGKPIRLHVRTRANVAVADAEVRIVAPDFEAARMSGFGAEYTLPEKGKRLPKLREARGGWARGQVSNEEATITIPAPGYYRVVASAIAHSGVPAYADSLRVIPETHREIWLRVDKRGGRITAQFDTTALPREAEARPGPMRCHVSLREEMRGKRRDPGCDGATVMAIVPICDAASDGSLNDCSDPCTVYPGSCVDPCEVDPASCQPQPTVPPLQPLPYYGSPCPVGTYEASYHAGIDLAGSRVLGRCETGIRHDWESGGPTYNVGHDNFSVRWTGWQSLAAGTYTFTARADDGVRLWVDNELLIDQWRDQGETNYRVTRELAGGTHHIRMEYYERGGLAAAQLSVTGGPYGGSDPCFGNRSRCFQFMYFDPTWHAYIPAPEGMRVKASYQDRDCFGGCWWNEERAEYHRADAEGRVILPCPANSDEKRLRTHYEFLDEYVAVGRDEWLGPEVHGCDTGWDREEVVSNREAFVYGNMRTAARRAVMLFGSLSDRVRVDFDGQRWDGQTSWYNIEAHHISILDNNIWGSSGRTTHAHEYGHSYHHRALGGIGHIYLSGWPSHQFHTESNGALALLEGFAHYFATSVQPGDSASDRFGNSWYVRRPEHWRGLATGVRSEARVSAFFFDLADYGAEKGSDHEEPRTEISSPLAYYWGSYEDQYGDEAHDQVHKGHGFVGGVLIFCRRADLTKPESLAELWPCIQSRAPAREAAALTTLYNHDVLGAF